MNTNELIKNAAKHLNRVTDSYGRLHGDVAAAVVSKQGKVYYGVCIDTPGWGLCAERSALAAMVTDGCYEIEKVVAVWRDDKTSKLHVLPPCGICRNFMQNLNENNLEAEVILGVSQHKPLKELIPHHEWPDPLDGDF